MPLFFIALSYELTDSCLLAQIIFQDGNLTFYLTAGQEDIKDKSQFSEGGVCDPDSAYSPSGASSMYGNAKRAGKSITVEAVNFIKWFDDLLTKNREKSNGGWVQTKVILKMDVEGAEKEILTMMTRQDASDSICKVNMLFMEYHFRIFREGTDEYNEHVEFKNNFPTMFNTKCGRELQINKWFQQSLLSGKEYPHVKPRHL